MKRSIRPQLAGPIAGILGAAAVLLIACIPVHVPGPGPTPAPVPTLAPKATPTPIPVVPRQLTSGRAVVELDLRGFAPEAPKADGTQLDTYAAAYLLWEPATAHPTTPALELQIRGVGPELCQSRPCGKTAFGLVARWSANVFHDGYTVNEVLHCGEGTNAAKRLPIGLGPLVRVVVEWGPGIVRVVGPTGDAWEGRRGAAGPGFGVFVAGLANSPRGVGWSRSPWTLSEHGGSARLVSWDAAGAEQRPVGVCP